MNPNEYQKAALTKMADQQAIQARIALLPAQAVQLDNGSRGVAEEAGEILACVKRYLEYGKPLDKDRVIDECGDALWRLVQTLDAVGSTLAEAMRRNLLKLNVRYAEGFTEAEAADENRDRVKEAAVQNNGSNTPIVDDVYVKLAKLQAFKDYVHKRLDDAGVPTEVPGESLDRGCRIAGRLDWIILQATINTQRQRILSGMNPQSPKNPG